MRNIRASGAESLVHDEWRRPPPRSAERTPPRGPQNWQQHEDQQPRRMMRPENTPETDGRPVEKRNLSWVNPVVRSQVSEFDAKERYLTQPAKSTERSARLRLPSSQPQRIPTGPARGQHRAVPYDRTPRQRGAVTGVNRIKKGKMRLGRPGTGGPHLETNALQERGAAEQIPERSLTASPTREDSRKSEGPAQRTTGFLPGTFDVVSNEWPTPTVQNSSPSIQDRASEVRSQEIHPQKLSPAPQSAYSPGNQTVSPSSPPIASSQQVKPAPSSQRPLTQQPSLLPPSKRQKPPKPLKPRKSLPSQSPRDLPRESSLDVLTEQEKDQLFSKIGKSAAKLLFSTARPAAPSVARTTESTNVGNQTSELRASEVPSNETIDDKPPSVNDSMVVVQAAMNPASIMPTSLPRVEDLTLGPNSELESQTTLQPRLHVAIPAIPEGAMLNIIVPEPSKPDGKPPHFPYFPPKLILQQRPVNAGRVFPPQAAVIPDTQQAPSSTPRPQKENARFATAKINGSIVSPDVPTAPMPTINHVMSPVLPKRF